jgi:NADPH-dependent curcumin reductase CurA
MQTVPSHSRRWVLAQHPTKNEKLVVSRSFQLESLIISPTSADSKKLLVKTRYLSNAPGLRVLIEETLPDREFSPVTIIIHPISIIAIITTS